jgi:hypothetical protein
MEKGARLHELFRRMSAAPAAGSADEALELITEILNAVEDEHSGVPNDPTGPRADERMFPPIERYHFAIEGRPDLQGYRQKAHDTIIAGNGAILIRVRKTMKTMFEKPGRDGRKVDP